MLVKMICDSLSPTGKRIVTMQLRYQRFIHAEFMTHRVFSRNASSSRAIPVAKMIEQVRNDPAMPVHWGKNMPGMQAREALKGAELDVAVDAWHQAANNAANIAELMNTFGLHKQVANRILEPFQFINVVVTATEWDNFFELRTHPDAQPEFQVLAREMERVMSESQPEKVDFGGWHLPYISDEEKITLNANTLIRMSAARCARVSYLKHDNTSPDMASDLELFNRLVGSVPLHASPIEHQAMAAMTSTAVSNNFRGWTQFRQLYENN